MINNKFIKFLILVLITLVLIILIEFISRITLGLPKHAELSDNVIPDKELNHKWKPNSVYEVGAEKPYTLYVNGQSWVSRREFSEKKPENTIRIFYVGDSNTLGPVKEEKKMTTIVENGLKKKIKNGKHVEVINTGTTSWSPSIYYLEIRNHILKYSPDIVVINFDMTDVRDDFIYKPLTTFDEKGLPIAVSPSDPKNKSLYRLSPQGVYKISPLQDRLTRVHEFIHNNSAFYYHFEKFVLSLKQKFKYKYIPPPNMIVNDEQKDANWVAFTWTKETQKNVDYSLFLLAQTIELLKEHNVKVVVTGVPLYPQYSGEWTARPHELIEKTAKEHGALYLNSYEELKNSVQKADRDTYYWESDPTHFNEEGNNLWAQAQLKFLLDSQNKLF
jgi:hypothetical protein